MTAATPLPADSDVSTHAPTFALDGVTVAYAQHLAVDDIHAKIAAGETVCFVGPSGAGKTTLLRLLAGHLSPDRGQVSIAGQDWKRRSHRERRQLRSRIGFVYQDFALIPNLRVIQNVLTGRLGRQNLLGSLRSVWWPGSQAKREVHQILDRVGIEEKLFTRVDQLSGGQQQRVAIARALFQNPWALLADEPVSAVDPARARDTIRLLTEISREQGITLVLSLHDLELAREFFPRLIGLRRGRIQFDAPPTELTDKDFADLYRLDADEMLEDRHS